MATFVYVVEIGLLAHGGQWPPGDKGRRGGRRLLDGRVTSSWGDGSVLGMRGDGCRALWMH